MLPTDFCGPLLSWGKKINVYLKNVFSILSYMYLIFIGMCGVVVEVQIGVMKVHGSNLGDCIIGIIYQPFFSKYLSQLVVILS